ncbi:MAG: hypothetical protein GAK35_02644 [Herbaspirillum frisingense]|uniref:Uncharacterized protein n=1 Tax=Herbaspirillum frisingense TaxID=92645 RepID=A0A7V8FVU0_9BURK|nr:MAG: hypothetical protein GAK35_02644 [Herbaspirillum frisingense]
MSEFDDCEYCSHCQTVNDDMDSFCHKKQAIVHSTCEHFLHFEGKKPNDAGTKGTPQ